MASIRMPRLQTLKPRLQAIDGRRVRVLQHDTVNPRLRGEKWDDTTHGRRADAAIDTRPVGNDPRGA